MPHPDFDIAWTPATESWLAPGRFLFRQDDTVIGLYAVAEGTVKLCRNDATGREVVLHFSGPAEFVAEASLFSRTYHCEAVAVPYVRLKRYPKDAFLAELSRDPNKAEAFMALLAREVMTLRTRLEQRNLRSAMSRVHHHLALNVGTDGRTVRLHGRSKTLPPSLD